MISERGIYSLRGRLVRPGIMGLSLLLVQVILLQGCRQNIQDSEIIAEESAYTADITEEAMAWADSVAGTLSLQKKIGQLFMPAVFTSTAPANMGLISDYADRLGVGGFVLLKGSALSAKAIADTLETVTPIGLFMAVDAETGLGMRFEDAPAFLWNGQISSEADELIMFDYGQELARECRLSGINMVLGPVLDVNPSESNRGSLGEKRSYGTDAVRVSRLGVAYSCGLESGGVLSVAKHFPGHGSARGDSHKRLAVVDKRADSLKKVDLFPFRDYIRSGLSCVMVGHIYAPSLDSVIRPASFSPVIITDLLRKDMNFRGLILTDALTMQGADGFNASDAIKAGADVILAPLHTESAMVEIRDKVESGELPESIINDRCRRVLFYKYLRGIAGKRGAKNRRNRMTPHQLYQGADTIREQLLR